MNVESAPALHLTYCTNIHPGESWDEVFANVSSHVLAVKARVSPTRPFGVGLRLSGAAAQELSRPAVLEGFRAFLTAHQLYVFTINGFPHGAFHGTAVKENVYRPDWLEEERLAYSDRLATLLAALVPAGLEGSVSTVPGCFIARSSSEAATAMGERLRRHALGLWRLREQTGRTITLALEPEPHCVLETSGDAVRFFERHLFDRASIAAFAGDSGLAAAEAEVTLRRHLGVCLDACHAAVEFEEPAEALRRLTAAGIRILKLQVSAGLRVVRPDPEALAALAPFAEGVYLHQVVIRTGGTLRRVLDLPQALAEARPGNLGDEWRIHFHVPLFRERLGPFQNTAPFLDELLPLVVATGATRHLEVETYTWDVLPEEHRRDPVDEAIARELRWTLDRLVSP
jgi:sugar phosphate isomerase/epimerase